MTDAVERARRILSAAGLGQDDLVTVRPLDGGTYNTVEELVLTDGRRLILKTPPPPQAPALRHEHELLGAEAEFYRGAATVGAPAPHVVVLAHGRLLMTACPGTPWHLASLEEAEQRTLRQELGGLVARLHRVTGPGFGYPSGALGPLAPDWRTAFTAMYDAVLADARRFRAWLPRTVDEVARTAKTAYDALDEVTVPHLVHFDLWQGNILVERDGAPRVGGLIDGERMFWGDPLADFVSLALLGNIEDDPEFLTGYQEAGGQVEFTSTARQRLALYRSYLYLIMLTETVPRAAGDEHVGWVREVVAPQLTAALDELGG
ncbi:aminoglycoside phosphotransferase family protein [Streptomyces sp. KM273126]|uniref:phosphotransferase family protein n=1 Tax=Streptomyces sp. KM273126 TaxID=2545247 RepID=UPI0015EB44B7|nr:aminoglycoside phosphotransferase family protein [Streptomyces sp. KM273126]MBA2810793.1 aminoglycoside phosphotransferase family protein [Streptomyces sp. KM273126]